MAYTNRTSELREAIDSKLTSGSSAQAQATRRRTTAQSRTDAASSSSQAQFALGKEYIKEAYLILNHVNTLTQMLSSIRKPYLNTDARNTPISRQGTRNLDLTSGADSSSSMSGIRYLTNEERDQIDMQARTVLSRCADRVKEMEALEKRRTQLISSTTSSLSRFLPSRLKQDPAAQASDFTAAHHAGITWYLSRRLAEASQVQREMQEERVRRQAERGRTLGSGATWEAGKVASLGAARGRSGSQAGKQVESPAAESGSWLGEASSNFIAATIGAPSPSLSHSPHSEPHSKTSPRLPDIPAPPSEDSDDEDFIELSSSQILQFETENANILASVQETLESVQQAEARLMDISALQMELVNHLTQQTELTDQLYEDAIATTSTVEKGNVQLKEAKRRAKDGRLFILVFLLGASFSLLFLHYY